jgi:serine acetyltransferase
MRNELRGQEVSGVQPSASALAAARRHERQAHRDREERVIAAGATIIGGVKVGENSVVAAGSVVTKDVSPDSFVGGNPARIIRSIGD